MSKQGRFSIYGDFWLHYMEWGVRMCPWFLEPIIVAIFTGIFGLFCGDARNAVANNLNVILPRSWYWVNQLRAFRVFWNFAWSMVDLIHVRLGEDVITWEIQGKRELHALEVKETGAVLLTAHMGNYDVAAPIFAHHFRRAIHMVRAPERNAESQKFQAQRRQQMAKSQFKVHYNEAGNMLGVELARAIHEGDVVAIQGDRILFDVAPLEVQYDQTYCWCVPEGPFVLSVVTRCNIHPVFIIRLGYRRYAVQASAEIPVYVEGRDRKAAMQRLAQEWSDVLAPVVRKHWYQWFVFESVFKK